MNLSDQVLFFSSFWTYFLHSFYHWPHLLVGSLGHASRSLSRVLASGCHSPLLHPSSFLDFSDLWVLTCFLYPLSPPKRLTLTWAFSGPNYNRKNVICSWPKKEETIFRYLSDYRQERVCLRVRDQAQDYRKSSDVNSTSFHKNTFL